jgi:two-component system, OmpR family, KDP operon response regulator KdpE
MDDVTSVLLVEDDTRLRRALRATFVVENFDVIEASTGEDALALLAIDDPDLVVLDLKLPGIDGIEVLEHLRSFSKVPVVVLTVRDQLDDRVGALNAGADDYVVKPFEPEELIARCRAHLRRTPERTAAIAAITVGPLTVDLALRRVTLDGEPVSVTPIEYRLLEVLVANPGRLMTREELLDAVWGTHEDEQRVRLRVTMVNLRRKLRDDAAHPRLIVTEPGLGYRWFGERD